MDAAVERLAEHHWDHGSTPGAYRRTLPSWAHGQYRRDARVALAVAVEDGLILSAEDVAATGRALDLLHALLAGGANVAAPDIVTVRADVDRLRAALGHGDGAR